MQLGCSVALRLVRARDAGMRRFADKDEVDRRLLLGNLLSIGDCGSTLKRCEYKY
jgi:hypothetical protein